MATLKAQGRDVAGPEIQNGCMKGTSNASKNSTASLHRALKLAL